MSQHTTIVNYGRCETTGKLRYATKADAKRVRERNPEFKANRPYRCTDCHDYHLGRTHGIQSRELHRQGDLAGAIHSTMSVRMAAEELGVTPDALGSLIDAGVIDTRIGDKGQMRIPAPEVERLKQLTWRASS